ncbi:MAG: DUF4352 domain-containing protein [Armatimonadetes bacterium]|nr:DUF4352 domain-containing protein [Armatimonadota bacterium]
MLKKSWTFAVLAAMVMALPSASFAQTGQKPKNETKGQSQLAGGYARFGETYSLKSGWNFQFISAKYTVQPFLCYGDSLAMSGQKLLVIDFSLKNATHDDMWFGGIDQMISVFDDKGAKYSSCATQLESNGIKSMDRTLKPGQGIGQPELKDPLRVCFPVPLDAKITKIILNEPRLGKNEEVVRFLMAGTDKESDPKNIIAPLPKNVADPSDPTGAVALKAGLAKIGDVVPSGEFSFKVTGVTTTKEALDPDNPLEDGKQYVVVTVQAKNIWGDKASYFDAQDTDDNVLVDADGEKYHAAKVLKASSNEEADTGRQMDPDDTYTVRWVFVMSEKSKATVFRLRATSEAYTWAIDLSK